MSLQNPKELYSFTVSVEKEIEDKSVAKQEDGSEVVTTKKVKKKVPLNISIRQPSRKEVDKADLEFAKKQSELIREGILTRAMISKKYADIGGVFSEEEAQELSKMYQDMTQKQNRFVELNVNVKKRTKKQEEELAAIISELTDMRKKIAEVESNYSTLFQHTADTKANNWVVLWYSLILTRIERDGEFVDYFEGNSFENKWDFYYALEDDPTPEWIELRTKLSYFMSFWYNNAISTPEDFKNLEEKIDKGEPI